MATAIIAFMSSSCSDNDKIGSGTLPDNICFDFATFVSSSEDGSVFQLQQSGDSPLITLTTTARVSADQIRPNTRVIIEYVPSGGQAVYQSGPIDLYGIVSITTGNITPRPLSDINSLFVESFKTISLTRTGEYLNVWAEAAYNSKIEKFELLVDETTLENEYPEAYLIFKPDNGGIYRQVYASFGLNEIWKLPTCKGVKVNYQLASGKTSMKFDKETVIGPGLTPVE